MKIVKEFVLTYTTGDNGGDNARSCLVSLLWVCTSPST